MKLSASFVTDKYICLMLLVFPLWTGTEGYANITFWKFAFFTAATAVWYALLIICAVREGARPHPPALAAALAALVWGAVSLAASPYSPGLMGWHYDGYLPLALYVLTALGVALYGEWREYYVNLIAVSCTLCCAVALLQLAGLNPLWLYPEGLDYYGGGVSYSGSFLGTLGNTNILGGFLCLSAALMAFTAIKHGKKRLWLLPCAALAALTLALSRSEAGLVGLLAAAALGVPYYVNLKSRRAGRAAAAFEAAAVLGFLAWLYLAAPAEGTLHELGELLHGRAEDGFGSSRVAIWREALRLFAERPLLGGGPGSFGLRSTLEFCRFVPESGLTLRTRADTAHCEALSALVDLGLPGLALYAAAAVYALRRGLFTPRGLALAAYLTQALFSTGTVFVLPAVAIFIGLSSREKAKPASIRRKRTLSDRRDTNEP